MIYTLYEDISYHVTLKKVFVIEKRFQNRQSSISGYYACSTEDTFLQDFRERVIE